MNEYFKEVTIVLISYKSIKKIINFINKLTKKNRIIIIENSNEKINNFILKNKNIEIYNVENKGYAGSINFARTKINTKYFFVFNPDVDEISDEVIEYFFQKAKELNNKFSCLGPRYKNISSKTLIQSNPKKKNL